MIRALTRRLRALLALPGAVEAATETAHLRAVVASQGASLLRRDAATAELMMERDDLRADVARLAEVARREIADRDDYAVELLGYARRWKALAGRLRNRAAANANDLRLSRENTGRVREALQRALHDAADLSVQLAAARAEAERLSAELRRLRG